jgi:hypothetical protein
MMANVRRSSPVQKSGLPEEQKKRTIHLLQNRTFYLLLTHGTDKVDITFDHGISKSFVSVVCADDDKTLHA